MKLPVLSLLSLFVFVGGCAATTGDEEADDQGVSSEEAISTSVTPGTFRLYHEPGHQPSGCDIYTKLELSKVGGAKATLSEQVGGMCMIAVMPNLRSFRLHQTGTSCGSKIYEGHRNVSGGVDKIKITDHRTRLCMDMLPAQIVVEETVPGFPGPITTTLYSMWPAPPVAQSVTVEGHLFRSFGIGGENTGRSIKTIPNSDVFELVLDANEQSSFVDGKLARVKGQKTLLSGIETHDRPAITVDEILVCPSPRTINCMPPVMGGAANLCSSDNRSWIESKCAGVSYVD